MKTINAIFTSVIVKEEITTAMHFDYEEAKDTMLRILHNNFNVQTDDAIIYMSEHPGEAVPIFNYRAFLNNEEQAELPAGKYNENVKVFFECPRCSSTDGEMRADEDGDIIMKCKECSTPVFVQ